MKQLLKYTAGILLFALLFCTLAGCGGGTKTLTGFGLNTLVSLTVYDGDEAALSGALQTLGKLERRLSRTVAGSEISAANSAGGAPVTLSEDTAELVRMALRGAELSGGKFDITVCPLTALWDFSAAEPKIPDAADLAAALSRVGYENIRLEGNTLTLSGGAEIDLGGIAKGYIADVLAEELRAAGKERAIVNLGGNIALFGGKPDGSPFSVGIQKPFAPSGETALTLSLRDGAIATSGTYERSFTQDGILYHHILDPDTGMPADTGLSSVTVIAQRAAEADLLSTVCFLLGEEGGLSLVERLPDTEAVFVRADGSIRLSAGLRDGNAFVSVN
ncbi:MAG: FAD:protein FMN transferase [Clostridia bacterium]|nr:FAD:protein FMN transferase [Clostridia bacterium]